MSVWREPWRQVSEEGGCEQQQREGCVWMDALWSRSISLFWREH